MASKRIVILGGGTGGTMTANRLRRRFGVEEAEIHVVDRDKRFKLEKISNNFLQVGHRNGAVQGRLYVKTSS